jgi:hypothetical protein
MASLINWGSSWGRNFVKNDAGVFKQAALLPCSLHTGEFKRVENKSLQTL